MTNIFVVLRISDLAGLIYVYLNQTDLNRLRITCKLFHQDRIANELLQNCYGFLTKKLTQYTIPSKLIRFAPFDMGLIGRHYLINTFEAQNPENISTHKIEDEIEDEKSRYNILTQGDLSDIVGEYFSEVLTELLIQKWDVVNFNFDSECLICIDNQSFCNSLKYRTIENCMTTSMKEFPPNYWSSSVYKEIPYDWNEISQFIVDREENVVYLEVDYSFGCKIKYKIDVEYCFSKVFIRNTQQCSESLATNKKNRLTCFEFKVALHN
jgi:hypothetical protein